MKLKYVLVMLAIGAGSVNVSLAQYDPDYIADKDSTNEEETAAAKAPGGGSNFFSGFSSGYSGSAPKVTAQSYKLGFSLGKDGANYWELNLFNSVPTVSPSATDTVEYVSNDLRKQFGGLANFSLSKTAYFGYGGDRSVRDVKGFQTDFRFGVKLVDTQNRKAGTDFLIPVFQSTFDVRYLIPLINARKATDERSRVDIKKSMVGNLSFRVSGSYMSIINTTTYDLYYATKQGILPNPNLLVVTPEMRFYVTNQIDFGVGYSYNNYDFLSNAVFFSISYGTPKSSN